MHLRIAELLLTEMVLKTDMRCARVFSPDGCTTAGGGGVTLITGARSLLEGSEVPRASLYSSDVRGYRE